MASKSNRSAARLPRQLFGPSKPFVALWTASTASNLADGFFKLALPLYAATLTKSPSQVVGVMTALTLPWLLFSLPVGSLADRLDRRLLMTGAHLLRVAVLVTFVVLMLSAKVPLLPLYVIAFALGVAEVVADTAAAAILPAVVEPEELEEANARLVGSLTVGDGFIGPALGGVLFALSMAAPFAVSASLYLAAAGALLYLQGTFRAARAAGRVQLSEVFEGLTFLWRHGLLRTLAILVTVMNVCWSAWFTLMPLHAVVPGPLGLDAPQYGLLLMCLGVGGLLGTLLAVPAQHLLGQRWAIGADILGTMMMLLVPALFLNPWLIGVAALLGGVGSTMWGIVVSSVRQRAVPNALLGRVSATLRLFGYGAYPLGAVLAGTLAELAGIRTVFALCALLTFTLFVPFFLSVTNRALAEAQASEGAGEYVA